MGRPSSYSEAIGDDICERLANGESLRRICLTPNYPRQATVFRWLVANETFREQYRVAREAQAETLADEIIDIADGKRAEYEGTEPDVQRDKLSVHARQWVASKLKPKVYGDKTLIGSDPDNPLPAGYAVNLIEKRNGRDSAG
ncbi:MAG: terminase small subunit protein [Bosea sp. (in: a-proteobacteria)]